MLGRVVGANGGQLPGAVRSAGGFVWATRRLACVRAPVGPTLDAVHTSAAGTVAVEAKTAEPWRAAPKVAISTQYDVPASKVSDKTVRTVESLRDGRLTYRCLDAAQLVKHLLGVHSALSPDSAPATLVLLYWRPSAPGRHADLLDLLESEIDDFAGRVDDQPVTVMGVSTCELLADWSKSGSPGWLTEHAAGLRQRYDPEFS